MPNPSTKLSTKLSKARALAPLIGDGAIDTESEAATALLGGPVNPSLPAPAFPARAPQSRASADVVWGRAEVEALRGEPLTADAGELERGRSGVGEPEGEDHLVAEGDVGQGGGSLLGRAGNLGVGAYQHGIGDPVLELGHDSGDVSQALGVANLASVAARDPCEQLSVDVFGDGQFADVSEQAGTTMGRWAWGSIALDLQNDRWPDLFIPNGFVTGPDPADL